jgi:UDP-glucose 4-epimerase
MAIMKKQRVVITGGSGFIGSYLIENLRKDRNIGTIVSLSRNPKKVKGVQPEKSDFANEKTLNRILKKDDIVVHLACSTTPQLSETDRVQDIEDNVIKTVRLLEICKNKQIKKFIFMSSGGTVYGYSGKKSHRENENCSPINSHGVMKLTIEKYLEVFRHQYGLNYIVIRTSNPYGRITDTQKNQGLIDIFFKKIIKNEELQIWGNGEIVRDYIHIEDLVNLIVKVIKKNVINEVINAGTGIGTSINRVINIIENTTGQKARKTYLKNRKFDIPHNVLSIKKAKKVLDWSPKISLKDGSKKLYVLLYK